MIDEPAVGSHLVSPRRGYTHHGIYAGQGVVIHYAGLAQGLESGPIEETTISRFSGGNGIEVRTYKNALPVEHVLLRARSRLGENTYSVFSNNCEHFCLWCIVGDHTSPQVDRAVWIGTPTVSGVLGIAARGLVAFGGPVAGLSGAGVMSGLAATGGIVGGGVVAGIALLGAVPATAMTSLMNATVLADNPTLGCDEREGRAAGRTAGYAGAATGTLGSVAAVAALGVTPGLSAAGITSGLAAIGGAIGGGMAAGVFLATAAPVLASAAAGFGVYRFARRRRKDRQREERI